MANGQTPTLRVYVREKGGKRSFHEAPSIPDLSACYWLRYEKDGKQTWQRVGHYDLVAKAKLFLDRRLSAEAQGFILPEDRAAETQQQRLQSPLSAIAKTPNVYTASRVVLLIGADL